MKKFLAIKNSAVVYQTKDGAIALRGDSAKETLWATQAQIVSLFAVDQSVVSRHIKNIFSDKEIDEKSNMQKMHIANSDKPVILYSLDVILSVGYRTNSKVAIEFRQWATKTLRQHITQGYTINKMQISKHYAQFLEAVESMKLLLPSDGSVDATSALELIKTFAGTWLSLDAYDKDELISKGSTKKTVALTAEHLIKALVDFKIELVKKGEATDIFGRERATGNIAGIVGNVMQSFGGKAVYGTVEEKAAHLLYFIVKNHPFTDGNKRSGAYAFIWFLHRANLLSKSQITPPALTALTLLIAESNPKDKERMVKLVVTVLKK